MRRLIVGLRIGQPMTPTHLSKSSGRFRFDSGHRTRLRAIANEAGVLRCDFVDRRGTWIQAGLPTVPARNFGGRADDVWKKGATLINVASRPNCSGYLNEAAAVVYRSPLAPIGTGLRNPGRGTRIFQTIPFRRKPAHTGQQAVGGFAWADAQFWPARCGRCDGAKNLNRAPIPATRHSGASGDPSGERAADLSRSGWLLDFTKAGRWAIHTPRRV